MKIFLAQLNYHIGNFEANTQKILDAIARAKAEGKYKGRQPKLSAKDAERLRQMHAAGGYTTTELGRFFGLHRTSVYRYLDSPAGPTQ